MQKHFGAMHTRNLIIISSPAKVIKRKSDLTWQGGGGGAGEGSPLKRYGKGFPWPQPPAADTL